VHDLSPPPINTLDRGKGISPAPEPGSSQPSPQKNSRPRRGRGRVRRNHRPATPATTDTVTNQPPTARHTVPATVGTHEGGAELWCPAAARRTAPATSTPSPSSGNNSAATVVGAQALPARFPRPVARPPVGRTGTTWNSVRSAPPARRSWQPVEYAWTATATLAARTPTPPGLPVAARSRHQRSGASTAVTTPAFMARCSRWSCQRVWIDRLKSVVRRGRWVPRRMVSG